ncbi:hypothetical protein GCM10010280_22880 [Streptomyces pilosus]|uniref:Uncharacterized protein n=1 Tax=Streptomyces pilosus TaxID=28893 RepID=A0A918BML4_9ACTN|nr:hypothetical protein GCM10010280_22880 [Streptomyces pilosus]
MQSGTGVVHNTLLLDEPERTISGALSTLRPRTGFSLTGWALWAPMQHARRFLYQSGSIRLTPQPGSALDDRGQGPAQGRLIASEAGRDRRMAPPTAFPTVSLAGLSPRPGLEWSRSSSRCGLSDAEGVMDTSLVAESW